MTASLKLLEMKHLVISTFAMLGIPYTQISKNYSTEEIYHIVTKTPIRILSPKQVADRVHTSRRVQQQAKQKHETLPQRLRLWLWDNQRSKAYFSTDPIAVRCSLDDYLWYFWKLAKAKGKKLSIIQIAHIMEVKSLVAQLYSKEVSGQDKKEACLFEACNTPDQNTPNYNKWNEVVDYLTLLIPRPDNPPETPQPSQ